MPISIIKMMLAKYIGYVIHITSQLLATVSFCTVDLLNTKKRLTLIQDHSQSFCTSVYLFLFVAYRLVQVTFTVAYRLLCSTNLQYYRSLKLHNHLQMEMSNRLLSQAL